MAELVYLLGFLVSFACSALLFRGYLQTRQRLQLWCGLCFFGLGISNVLVFSDPLVRTNLYPARLVTAVIAMAFMVFGLIWEAE